MIIFYKLKEHLRSFHHQTFHVNVSQLFRIDVIVECFHCLLKRSRKQKYKGKLQRQQLREEIDYNCDQILN